MSQANKLPARPHLGFLRKLAKDRLDALRAADSDAKLADAQLVVAREHGFASWRSLQAQLNLINQDRIREVAALFERFASVECRGSSHLYERLSLGVAQDHDLLELAAYGRTPIPNLFFAATHYLLYRESSDRLAASYPSIHPESTGISPNVVEHLRTFCLDRRGEIALLMRTRLVQTNEVARCAYLRVAIRMAWHLAGKRPIHLIEVGCSAGLNLCFDRYGYDYGNGLIRGDSNSTVRVHAELRGQRKPSLIDDEQLPIVARIGIDLNPIHPSDTDSIRWLKALVWPEHEDRRHRLIAALDITRTNPPTFITGDASEVIASTVRAAPKESIPIIFQTHALNQFSQASRTKFLNTMLELSLEKELMFISRHDRLTLDHYIAGRFTHQILAECDGHGRWIEWTSQDEHAWLHAFLDAAVPKPDSDHKSGSLEPARRLLADAPDLIEHSIFAACVAGNASVVEKFLSKDQGLARMTGGPRDWTALCYLTFSRFLRDKKNGTAEFLKCAKLLLDAGADPNSSWPAANDPTFRETALYGAAGIANNAPITKLLIDAGADVNDHETLYHACEFADNAALRVLLDAKPNANWVSSNLCHKMDMEDPAGVKLFIVYGADVNVLLRGGMFKGSRPLHFAIYRRRSLKIFRMLLLAGADPNLADSKGITPYQLARMLGSNSIARLLAEKGAVDLLDPRIEFLAALSSGDRKTVNAMLTRNPSLKSELTESDYKLLVDAGESGRLNAARLMLDHGFPIATRGTSYGGWDATALDQAAWNGHGAVVRLLLKRGADPTAKHGYGGDALGAAIHGASHAGHGRLSAIEPLARVASEERLRKAITYAKTEPNQEVTAILERVIESLHSK